VVAVATMNRLRGDARLGRTFIRYPANFSVEMRYGGRVFSGEATDVSRGGVMFLCADQMPPVGTMVGLRLFLPNTDHAVQVQARVARVEMSSGGTSSGARVGVEFSSFSGREEALLIAYLSRLDPDAGHRQPTVIKTLPPV